MSDGCGVGKISQDPIIHVIPKTGWLREYVEFSSGLEACARFQFFTACCILGAAINNRVFLHRGDKELLPPLFPNPWVILLAPSGRGHKTSTINMGVNALMEAVPETRILADKITPESLLDALSMPKSSETVRIGPCDATGLIRAPEISVFFNRVSYNEGLIQLITDLYDFRKEWSSQTIKRGRAVLRNICISIIAGSTPNWLQSKLPDDAFSGGFMARFVIVEMPHNYYRRVALPQKPSQSSWDSIVSGLRRLAEVEGEIEMDAACCDYYKETYENITPVGNEQIDAYREKEIEHIIRIAMLLAICDGRMTLRVEDMEASKRLLDELSKEALPRIEQLSTHPRMRVALQLQNTLRDNGPLARSVILEKLYKSLSFGEQQFVEAIRVLSTAGIIRTDGPADDPVYYIADCDVPNKPRRRRSR